MNPIEKLTTTLASAIEEICNQIVILQNNSNAMQVNMERMKSEFQLQINFQSFQIIELQKRNDAIWETVMKPTQT